MQNLSNSSPENTELEPQKVSISLYTDKLATGKEIMQAVVAIKKAFPSLPTSFYDMFDNRIKDNKFTANRLRDAVIHVIDNCIYPTPTIANFISFDRTVKFKTHDEMCKEAMTYPQVWQQWLPVRFPNMPKTVWVFANDIEKYKLTEYVVKPK